MNFFPKQIIYPIKYFNFIKKNKKLYYKKFFEIFFIKNKSYFFLGRARSGIYISVKEVINLKKKNIILLSPFTIPDIINIVIAAGGKPVFLDFNKNSLDISLNSIVRIKNKYQTSIAAVLITHYNLNQINYLKIYLLCKKFNFSLIEDCAISLSGFSRSVRIGSLSDFSIYSFSSFKFLNYFWGGLLIYKNFYRQSLLKYKNWRKLNIFNYFPQLLKTLRFQILTNLYIFRYFTIRILKFKLNQGQLLDKIPEENNLKINSSYFSVPSDNAIYEIVRKAKFYNQYLNNRRLISLIYLKFLKNISLASNTDLYNRILQSECGCYIILAKNYNHKNYLRKKLLDLNFDVGKFYYHNSKKIDSFKNIEGKIPNLNSLIDKIIILPTHPKITPTYATLLAKKILEIY
jgi:perosamine synthetase